MSGFVTGLGGIVTLPVTVPAAMAGMYIIATRMSAGIAHLRGYDVETDEVRSGILVALLGSAGTAVLRNAGVQIGQRSTAAARERLPGRVLAEINKQVGYQLVTKAGEKGVINLTKLSPSAPRACYHPPTASPPPPRPPPPISRTDPPVRRRFLSVGRSTLSPCSTSGGWPTSGAAILPSPAARARTSAN